MFAMINSTEILTSFWKKWKPRNVGAKINLPAMKPWHYLSIRLTHLQISQSSCPNLSYDQFSQSCLAGGKIAPGVYILPHKAKQECIFYLIK